MKTEDLVKALVGTVECNATDNTAAILCAHAANRLARQSATIKALTEALECAEEWLSGWASAEPYITVIQSALVQAREEE